MLDLVGKNDTEAMLNYFQQLKGLKHHSECRSQGAWHQSRMLKNEYLFMAIE